MSVILQRVFTETRLEDVDRTKTLPCKYFFKMERGNPSQEPRAKPRVKSELRKQQYTVTLFDCNHHGTRYSYLANAKIYVLLYSFCFVLF